MEFVARLLRELGYQHVVGILDGNKSSRLGTLEAEFPDYHFVVIPADDVRAKVARPAKDAVEGLADSSGRVQPQYEQAVRELFDCVNSALSR